MLTQKNSAWTNLFDLDVDRDLLRFVLDDDLLDLECDLRSRDRDFRERFRDLDRDFRDRETDLRRCERWRDLDRERRRRSRLLDLDLHNVLKC